MRCLLCTAIMLLVTKIGDQKHNSSTVVTPPLGGLTPGHHLERPAPGQDRRTYYNTAVQYKNGYNHHLYNFGHNYHWYNSGHDHYLYNNGHNNHWYNSGRNRHCVHNHCTGMNGHSGRILNSSYSLTTVAIITSGATLHCSHHRGAIMIMIINAPATRISLIMATIIGRIASISFYGCNGDLNPILLQLLSQSTY